MIQNTKYKILNTILRYGLLLAVFAPLVIFRNNFSVFNFGKVIVFRMLIEVLLIVYVILAVKYEEFRPWPRLVDFKKLKSLFNPRHVIFTALGLFTLSFLVSTFLGVNWHKSFWGEWERMGGLFSWLHYYAFFIMLISVFRKREDWLNILWLSVFTAIVSSFYGFLQKGESLSIVGASPERGRILGTLGNAAAFAGYLLFNFYFALYLFFESKSKKIKAILIAICAIFGTAIYLTVVRGAVLALAVSLFLFLLLLLIRKRKIIASAILIIAVIATAIFLFRERPNIEDSRLKALTNYSLQSETIKNRLIVWGVGLEGVKAKPVFGWGPEGFEPVFALYYNPALFRGTGTNVFDRAHNIFIDTAVAQGLLGLAAFLFLWFAFARFVIGNLKSGKIGGGEASAFAALTVAYFINNFFFFDLSSGYIMLAVLFGFAHMLANEKTETRDDYQSRPEIEKFKLKYYYAVLVIAAMGALVYWANIRPALANYYSTRGYVALYNARKYANAERSQKDYDQGILYFKKAVGLSGWSRSDVLRKFSESFTDTATFLVGKMPEEALKRDGEFLVKNLTEDREQRNLEFPSYIYEYKTERLLALYVDPDLFNEIREKQLEAVKKFPNVVELYYDLAESNYYLKKYDEYITASEKAYELNPTVAETKFILGQAYAVHGADKDTKEKGILFLADSAKSGALNYKKIDWLGSFLEKNKKYKLMIDVFQVLAEKDSGYNVQLSYSYLLSGDKAMAKEIADKAFMTPLSPEQNQALFEIYRKIQSKK